MSKRVIFEVSDEQLHELKAYCAIRRMYIKDYIKDLIYNDWKNGESGNEKVWEEELR
jgi:hypothetical protein